MPSFGKESYKYLHHFAFNQLISSVSFQGLSDKDNMNSDSSNKGHNKVRTIPTTFRHQKHEWNSRAAVCGYGLTHQLQTNNVVKLRGARQLDHSVLYVLNGMPGYILEVCVCVCSEERQVMIHSCDPLHMCKCYLMHAH